SLHVGVDLGEGPVLGRLVLVVEVQGDAGLAAELGGCREGVERRVVEQLEPLARRRLARAPGAGAKACGREARPEVLRVPVEGDPPGRRPRRGTARGEDRWRGGGELLAAL